EPATFPLVTGGPRPGAQGARGRPLCPQGILRMAKVASGPGSSRPRLVFWVATALCCGNLGCGGGRVAPTTDPEAKLRLEKLLKLYQAYADKNKQGPPNEQALREFGQKMSPKERDEYGIGDDVDKLFISPRDNQKYVIQYNLKLDPGSRALAWEATGQGGRRFVALTMGYVVECDDEQLKEYKK